MKLAGLILTLLTFGSTAYAIDTIDAFDDPELQAAIAGQ